MPPLSLSVYNLNLIGLINPQTMSVCTSCLLGWWQCAFPRPGGYGIVLTWWITCLPSSFWLPVFSFATLREWVLSSLHPTVLSGFYSSCPTTPQHCTVWESTLHSRNGIWLLHSATFRLSFFFFLEWMLSAYLFSLVHVITWMLAWWQTAVFTSVP